MIDERNGVSLASLRTHLQELLGDQRPGSLETTVACGLLDTSQCIVLVLDSEHQVVFANSFCEKLLGYSLEEMEGLDWLDHFIADEIRTSVANRFAKAMDGQATFGHVNDVETRGGARAVRWYDRPVYGDTGDIVGLLCIGHDVTDERAALDELRIMNERLEELVAERTESLESANRVLEATIDTSVVCFAYLDTDFRFVRVNRAYAATFDEEPDFFVGKSHIDLFPNAEREAIFRRVRDSGEAFRVQARPFLYDDDQPKRNLTYWDWALVPIFDGGDEVSGLVLSVQDVTDRVKMLEIARDREAALIVKETALRSSINGIGIADTTGTLTYVNPSFLRLWELDSEEEALGRHVTDFWVDPEAAAEVLGGLFEGGAWFGRLVAKLPGDRTATMQISANVVVDGDTPIAVMASFVDVTSEVLAEERQAEQLAEKEVLLREIHHRVKNNLQVVSSLLYLQSTRTETASVRALFNQSRDRLTAMALVHETLYQSNDLSKVDVKTYLSRLVHAISTSHSAPSRGITIDVDVSCPDMTIEVAVPCGLIVNEWTTNALKHAFDGTEGHVQVRAWSEEDGRVHLEVVDDGMGFEASDDRPSEQLGLKLVDALAEQLKGELEFSSVPGSTTLSVVFGA